MKNKENFACQTILSATPDVTFNIGREIARQIFPPCAIIVEGDLGAGKTVFIKGFAKELGIDDDIVSPTFTIVNQYPFLHKKKEAILNHFDLYRLEDFEELYFIGIEDFLADSDAINLFEWGERFYDDIEDYAPLLHHIRIEFLSEDERKITIHLKTPPEHTS